MNERIKELRKTLSLSQEEFGKRVGVTKASISKLEKGERNLTTQMSMSICREFNASQHWLQTGEGDMFKKIPEEDETAVYVSELLEDEDNPLFDIIKEIMHTYNELDPKSKEALKIFSANLITNLKRRA